MVVHRPSASRNRQSVERADDLALLDPAQPQRTVGMRATAREGHDFFAVAEDGHPHAGRVPGYPATLAESRRAGRPRPIRP